MSFDPQHYGAEGITDEDRAYAGSRYAEVRDALHANRYYDTWGERGDPPLPVYAVTLLRTLRGVLPKGLPWLLQEAASRTVRSNADLRWGPDRRGFRRLVHPNGVCLFGRWEIDDVPGGTGGTGYTGYFKEGSRGLIIGRYSPCCSETRRGHTRSMSLVGKIYPTLDPDHAEPLRPANFIAQEDLGGTKTTYINDVEIRNAPDVTPWRRGAGTIAFLVTGLAFMRADKEPTMRQVYPVAELGKPEGEPTRAPKFMCLRVDESQPRLGGAEADVRDEILAQIYDKGDPEPKRQLVFNIDVSDAGEIGGLLVKRLRGAKWTRIGRIVFDAAVASHNGDYVIHFPHPPWRADRNDPNTLTGPAIPF